MNENPYKSPSERPPLVPKKPPFLERLEDAIMTFGVRAIASLAGIAAGGALAMCTEGRFPQGDQGFYVLVFFVIGVIAGGTVGWFLSRMVIRAIFRIINASRGRSGGRQRP